MIKQQKGFTLIELLVVIAIIGLLSTLAVVSLNSARSKARDGKRLSEMKNLQTALEMYYNDKSIYPTSTALGFTLGDSTHRTFSEAGFTAAAGSSGSVYAQTVNPDPMVSQNYTYYGDATGTMYFIRFNLENNNAELGGKSCTFSNTSTSCS